MILKRIIHKARKGQFGFSSIKLAMGLLTGRPLTGPFDLMITPSYNCNFSCFFCHTHSYKLPKNEFSNKANKNYFDSVFRKNPVTMMPFEMYQSIIDDACRLKVRKIDLSGFGEPTLHPKILEMIHYAKQKGMYCFIITNGSRLTKETVDEYFALRLDSINISINSLEVSNYQRIHGVKNSRILDNILSLIPYICEKRLSAKNFNLTVSFAIDSDNYREVENILNYLSPLDIDVVHLTPVDTFDFTEEWALNEEHMSFIEELLQKSSCYKKINFNEFKTLYERSRGDPIHTPCYAGFMSSVINSNGDVFPCCRCKEVMGNVGHESFYNIWYGEKYRKFRADTLKMHRTKKEPNNCFCNTCNARLLYRDIYKTINPLDRFI